GTRFATPRAQFGRLHRAAWDSALAVPLSPARGRMALRCCLSVAPVHCQVRSVPSRCRRLPLGSRVSPRPCLGLPQWLCLRDREQSGVLPWLAWVAREACRIPPAAETSILESPAKENHGVRARYGPAR